MLLFFLLLLSCPETETACIKTDDIYDRWLQVYVDDEPVGGCYMFQSNGVLLEKDESHTWKSGSWYLDEDEDCDHVIKSDDHTVEILDASGGCWSVLYDDDQNLEVCSCAL